MKVLKKFLGVLLTLCASMIALTSLFVVISPIYIHVARSGVTAGTYALAGVVNRLLNAGYYMGNYMRFSVISLLAWSMLIVSLVLFIINIGPLSKGKPNVWSPLTTVAIAVPSSGVYMIVSIVEVIRYYVQIGCHFCFTPIFFLHAIIVFFSVLVLLLWVLYYVVSIVEKLLAKSKQKKVEIAVVEEKIIVE